MNVHSFSSITWIIYIPLLLYFSNSMPSLHKKFEDTVLYENLLFFTCVIDCINLDLKQIHRKNFKKSLEMKNKELISEKITNFSRYNCEIDKTYKQRIFL